MTNYDEWKTTETFSDEADFVAKRRDELLASWAKDKSKVTEAIADALSDDGDDFFAGLMADLFCNVAVTGSYIEIARSAVSSYRSLTGPIFARLVRDAETAAQAAWDSRLTGPEGDL